MEVRDVVLGIGGGVGPAAGVRLQQTIIEQTRTDGTDQSHFQVVHVSSSSRVQDRTKFLLGEIAENPGEGMAGSALAIQAAAAAQGAAAIVGVPCNTFHAPKIWRRFVDRLGELGADLRLVHMLDETRAYIGEVAPRAKRVGLLSTTGTRQSGVYRDLLKDLEVVEVSPELQREVHLAIYDPDWGIKAKSPVSKQAVQRFRGFARELQRLGAEVIILGCTEIPLALPGLCFEGTPLCDPVVALARAMVRLGDPAKLLPLHEEVAEPCSPGPPEDVAEPEAEREPRDIEYYTMPRTATPWGLPAVGPTFAAAYPTEFRQSSIEGAGLGWWATGDIPAGVRLRRATVQDGSLLKFTSPEALLRSGWDIDDAVNFGMGHRLDPAAVCFLRPGTPVNHADPTRRASIRYTYGPDALEIWTTLPVKAGAELFCDYAQAYAPCGWYDEMQRARGNVPLCQVAAYINKLYSEPCN